MEITNRTFQGRYFLRPDPAGRLNEIVLGVLGHAQHEHDMTIHAVSFLSTHFHLLASPKDVEQMASFMRDLKVGISKELGRIIDWSGRKWDHRYKAIPVTEEPEAQIARLKYILAAGCKEGLVDRPEDWPGVQSVGALVHGQELRGSWFDRTAEYQARRRGKETGHYDFATEQTVRLSPLPAWQHLPQDRVRELVTDLVTEIEDEAAAHRRETDRPSLGKDAIVAVHPLTQPAARLERSPAPRVHAYRRKVRRRWLEMLSLIFEEYQDAADRLRAGLFPVCFPAGTFPPPLPFKRGDPLLLLG